MFLSGVESVTGGCLVLPIFQMLVKPNFTRQLNDIVLLNIYHIHVHALINMYLTKQYRIHPGTPVPVNGCKYYEWTLYGTIISGKSQINGMRTPVAVYRKCNPITLSDSWRNKYNDLCDTYGLSSISEGLHKIIHGCVSYSRTHGQRI